MIAFADDPRGAPPGRGREALQNQAGSASRRAGEASPRRRRWLVFAVLLVPLAALPLSSVRPGANPPAGRSPADMARVPAGAYCPFYRGPAVPKEIPVPAFELDVTPVTNGQFLEFVRANPRWQRSRVTRLFADEAYLRHWAGDLDLGPEAARVAKQPVTSVSWFAAKAYAAWAGRRLPTTAEWELAASVGFNQLDGARDARLARVTRSWYESPPLAALPAVAASRANWLGLHDLHGPVWEWTCDFNAEFLAANLSGDAGIDRDLFCAADAASASGHANYAALVRFEFRSCLKADYAVATLGFRCAKDLR